VIVIVVVVVVVVFVFVVVVVGGGVLSVEVLMVVLIAICLPVGSIEANFMAFACKQILKFSYFFTLLLLHFLSPFPLSICLLLTLVQLY